MPKFCCLNTLILAILQLYFLYRLYYKFIVLDLSFPKILQFQYYNVVVHYFELTYTGAKRRMSCIYYQKGMHKHYLHS